MRAQVLFGIGNLRYVHINKPSPKKGEALLHITRCGICGSDIPRIYKTGAHNMPIIPGHEFAGIIQECPEDESLIGKRAAVFPLIPCKTCPQCLKGHYEMCENYNYLGSRCDGGFAEYVSVPMWNLLPIPDEITDDEAAMLEPMSVAVHAMRRCGICEKKRPATGDKKMAKKSIVVCGLGTIGLLLSLFLRDAGCKNVIFIGNKNIQKEKLMQLGFDLDNYCDVRYGDPADFIMDKTMRKGADIYFECIGRPESYEQAVKCTGPLGTIMLVGNPLGDMNLKREIYWKILRNQMTILGTWNSSYLGPVKEVESDRKVIDDWQYVIERLLAWKKAAPLLSVSNFITHRYNLKTMHRGLDIMKRKSEEYIKIMIDCTVH